MKSVAILHDLRSVLNVGAIFRTCDAVGVNKLYLTGITPTPLDRFGRVRADISKAALGAEMTVAWESAPDIGVVIKNLKKENFKIIAIEQSDTSIDYKKVHEQNVGNDLKIAFLVGNEVNGLSKEILNDCDVVAHIPMKGTKESLNVSTAFGVAVYRILNV